MTANSREQPYSPSWVDRFTDWVEELSLPVWAFYGGLGLALILIQVFFLWLDGGWPFADVLLPVMIFNGLSIPFLLPFMRFLDVQAVAALDAMRPTLEVSGPEFEEFRYKLANMPSRAPMIAGLAVLAFSILQERLGAAPARFAALEPLPLFTIVFQIFDKAPAFVFGAFFYHTVRQLRLVRIINSNYARISLYHLGPLQAFSRLTASTAVGLVLGLVGWMLINPDLLADPVSLAFSGSYAVLATAVFVWPLWGIHRLMEEEKQRALYEVDQRLEAVFATFNQHIRDDDLAATERLHGTIASLEVQYQRIRAIPTWPWSPETARIVLTAIALPLILMIIQFFVLQALGE